MNATFLNGCVDDFYDPYRNKIISKEEAESSKHICIPFLFTQSGIKPLTSVSMSRRYVELYDKFSECDGYAIIGFGFNSDDGHINGLFRELIEDKSKTVTIFHYGRVQDNLYEERLRLSNTSHLNVVSVNNQRQVNGKIWYDILTNGDGRS